jgi:hypothetical protein
MAEYTPPPNIHIPFSFSTGGYQAPDFDAIAMNLKTGMLKSAMANLSAAINVIPTYQHETFTFLKYCERYIVGYSARGVQIINGKCHYGGIRDLGANIGGHYPVDLPAFLRGVIYADLPAEIFGEETEGMADLGGIISAHSPIDLGSIIVAHSPENLSAYIRGFAFRNLPASLNILFSNSLPAEIGGHLPEDLPGYIKPWPQEDLPGSLHGWQEADLGAYLNMIARENLPAIIAGHRPGNLKALIKGWVREATYDLGASVHSFAAEDLGGIIRGTFKKDLPAYLFPIQPRNLNAFIHGWQEADLGGIIDAKDYPWNLPASIIGRPWKTKDLGANISPAGYLGPYQNLTAYILVTQGINNLPAIMGVKQARNLGAYIDPGKDIGNLNASIYPKVLYLTGVLSMITMEHNDLSATISIPCFYSNLKDLSAYIRPVFQSNLGAYINPKDYAWGQKNLGATFGYALNTVVQDKLNININITPLGFRTEDKFNINLALFRSGLNLGATITAQRQPRDLSAYINALNITPYNFEVWKNRERVYDTTYTQALKDYEDVDISFQTIVKDYFYSSGSNVVAKVDRYTHFVTKVASYYSPATSRRLNRQLHKVKYLYDMRHFDSIDEAMRYAIWYVTTKPEQNLGAYINSIKPLGLDNLSARIGAKRFYSSNNNLTSYIEGTATHSYEVVIGYTDDGVGYLQF